MSDISSPFTDAIQTVCRLLGREAYYVDEDGYDRTITAAACDVDRERYAWVEWRSRDRGRVSFDDYNLYGMSDGSTVIRWEIETYNPYFGCRVGHLAWYGERLVIIYHEKHDTYICSLAAGEPVNRLEIPDDWRVDGSSVVFPGENGNPTRLSLPDLLAVEQ